MSGSGPEAEGQEAERPTIRDRRRIDPETYQVREPQSAAAPAPGAPGAPTSTNPASTSTEATSTEEIVTDEEKAPAAASGEVVEDATQETAPSEATDRVAEVEQRLAERTEDLQRLQAEYVNYKRRVDRDRDQAKAATIEGVMGEFLPVLDTIHAADEHGELTGGFKAVADELLRVTGKYGLAAYGEKGDPFDPHIHDALMQMPGEGDADPVCVEILQVGYRLKERVLRPARVAVGQPPAGDPAPAAEPDAAGEADASGGDPAPES